MKTTAKWMCFLIGILLIGLLTMSLPSHSQSNGISRRLTDKILYHIGIERRTAKISRCKDNLRSLQVFKEMWASEEGKTTNDIPTWNDLRLFFPDRWSNSIPICPVSGSYKINRVGERPTCSVGGLEHSLP